METLTFHIERFETPTGRMLLVTDEQSQVRALDWEDHEQRMQRLLRRYYRNSALTLRDAPKASFARRALLDYFSGQLEAIDEIQVATSGTEFQSEVWQALRRIPRGQTLSYGALAKKIGRPAAVRAVGLANGANPIAIVVPCHRVMARTPRSRATAAASNANAGCSSTKARYTSCREGVRSGIVSPACFSARNRLLPW
jgi:methylated-DNA-[protein]-cysteine S-methyltransferase